ncbi:hypothetical protein [Aminobacter niigataensis]|uniref:hypothetical protein n=1 Tax=Aminobacter niigataensis TaxID=83265 RepID=UPI0024C58003|nr:hypothetical protein [Aminobacter niigataensis]CAI2932871.1 conserved protein of unknown function [Aminobacter niigataensis]
MKNKFVASVLSALLYTQGLLGFAAVASVLLKDRAHAETMPIVETAVPATAAPAR